MIYSTFAGAMRTCALIGALLLLMALPAAAHPVDDPADPVYRARTVLPDAAKARRDTPALETLRAAAPRTVHLADAAATAETRQLYAYLTALGRLQYTIYGHQNDAHHKFFRIDSGTNSDTKDMTGALAGIVGLDALSLTGEELELTDAERAAGMSCADKLERIAAEASNEGAILTLSMHIPNLARAAKRPQADGSYDFSGYSPDDLSGHVLHRAVPGGDLHPVYTAYLDMVADFLLHMQRRGIPVLFRPLHEHNGDWFWWGVKGTDGADYTALWQYTVHYLRDVRGVHNVLYVYAPNAPFSSERDYLDRYPGDAYVDVFGFDFYDDDDDTPAFLNRLEHAAALVVSAADAHGKLPALTEAGVHKNGGGLALTGNDDLHWTSAAAAVARRHHIPYLMTWANFEQEEKNFYQPFMVSDTRGHELVDGFIDYYNEETSLFADGLGDWRGLPVPVQE